MMDEGFKLENYYFVGHSLGAHLLSYISKDLKSTKNFTMTRVTGLDPAGPLFYPAFYMSPLKRLEAADAK